MRDPTPALRFMNFSRSSRSSPSGVVATGAGADGFAGSSSAIISRLSTRSPFCKPGASLLLNSSSFGFDGEPSEAASSRSSNSAIRASSVRARLCARRKSMTKLTSAGSSSIPLSAQLALDRLGGVSRKYCDHGLRPEKHGSLLATPPGPPYSLGCSENLIGKIAIPVLFKKKVAIPVLFVKLQFPYPKSGACFAIAVLL